MKSDPIDSGEAVPAQQLEPETAEPVSANASTETEPAERVLVGASIDMALAEPVLSDAALAELASVEASIEPESVDASMESTESSDAPQEIEHWWQAEGMPWAQRKPGRADIACMATIMVVAAYSLVMLPLRPVMIGFTPHLLAGLGFRTGIVMVGALGATGDPWWPLLLVLGTLMVMKFDWIYWWAGKLWGRGIIEMWSGRSRRARKFNGIAEKLALKYETLAILLTFLPIPIPAGVIYAVLGWAGTSLRKFLIVDFIGALTSTVGYMALGFALGAPAVAFVDEYSRWLVWVSVGILVVVLGSVFFNERRRTRD